MAIEKNVSEQKQDVADSTFHNFVMGGLGIMSVVSGAFFIWELDWSFRGFIIIVFGVLCAIMGWGALPHAESLGTQQICMYFYYGGLGLIPFGVLIRCIGEGIRETRKCQDLMAINGVKSD